MAGQRAETADREMMQRALRLAARAQGYVEPNPMVGCVLVRAGRIVGEGYHRRFGGPHAEVHALRQAGAAARGATAYVTLEPCCHHGKTPPCVDALLAAGVKRVVAAMRDPNPAVRGRGFRVLRAAGVQVEIGLLEAEALRLTAPFCKIIRTRRPWVLLKWAQSVDGRIATRAGDSRWISDEAARRHAHAVRGRVDAVIVGVGTVLADDPLLTCRLAPARRVATRVILDTHLRTPADAAVVRTARDVPTLVLCGRAAATRRAVAARRRALERAGCEVVALRDSGEQKRRGSHGQAQRARNRGGHGQAQLARERDAVSLGDALDELGRRQMTNVLVEGGASVIGAMLDEQLADELHVYIGRVLIGGQDALAAVGGVGPARVAEALRLPADARIRPLGSGWLMQAAFSAARYLGSCGTG